MDRTFDIERLAAMKASIIAIENAEIAILSGGVQEYRLDTGQTVTNVTKLDISKFSDLKNSMLNQYNILYNRIYGGGTRLISPGF